jgi:transposase
MNFFKKLFTPPPTRVDFYNFSVTCNRCGETIEGRVNLNNDLSVDYENNNVYHVRKVVMGNAHCFQRIEVELTFNAARTLLEQKIEGGKFVE